MKKKKKKSLRGWLLTPEEQYDIYVERYRHDSGSYAHRTIRERISADGDLREDFIEYYMHYLVYRILFESQKLRQEFVLGLIDKADNWIALLQTCKLC